MFLVHRNDGKQKLQSHEIFFKEDANFYNEELNIFSHDISDICGYGETKEEALEDLKNKFSYVMDELRAVENMLFSSDVYDCFK